MIEEFNTEQYEIAIEEVRDLHGNMSVLSRLYAILSDPNSRISEAVELLQSDGALSAIILRFSNGALFSPNERSDSIEMALQQVGFQKTLKLVGAALSNQVFMRNLNAYGITADSYWRYSYFTAIFMGKQAPICGINANTAYLMGLLHSIGRVIINELLHTKKSKYIGIATFLRINGKPPPSDPLAKSRVPFYWSHGNFQKKSMSALLGNPTLTCYSMLRSPSPKSKRFSAILKAVPNKSERGSEFPISSGCLRRQSFDAESR